MSDNKNKLSIYFRDPFGIHIDKDYEEAKWPTQEFSIEDLQAWVGCPDGRCLLHQRNVALRSHNLNVDAQEEAGLPREEEKVGQSFLLWLPPCDAKDKMRKGTNEM